MSLNVLDYEKHFEYRDGGLYWKHDRGSQKCNGKLAGTKTHNGYIRVRIRELGGSVLAHQIIFAMHHKYFAEFIDHIDGNKSNNRIENLRAATKSQNNSNRFLQKNNTTGHKNVYWNKKNKNWFVSVNHNSKKKYFGSFNKIDDALVVADQARKILHGCFANDGVTK